MEDSPSGLWRTLGKRVGVTASRVRISYPPPGLEPRKPLKSFGFRGFALVPSDCRFPPDTLRLDTSGPDPPRVSHIGTDDSENAFEPPPAARPPSKSDPAPRVPPAGRVGRGRTSMADARRAGARRRFRNRRFRYVTRAAGRGRRCPNGGYLEGTGNRKEPKQNPGNRMISTVSGAPIRAEDTRFELVRLLHQHAFQACAIDH